MITLTNILNETSRAVLKVIQGPLASFSYKSWRMRMQLILDPFFSRLRPSPPELSKERRKNGTRTGLGSTMVGVPLKGHIHGFAYARARMTVIVS